MNIVTLYVTTSTRDEALSIADSLLAERLAACANILDGMTSVYHWQGSLHRDSETVLRLKTRVDLVDLATTRIRSLHSYDCPCIVAWPVVGGNPAYADWVAQETQPPSTS